MKKNGLILLAILFSNVSKAQKITDGTWYNEEKTSRVKFYIEGDKLFGKIVWLKEPIRNGKARVDEHNPNSALVNKPLIGLIFLKNFEKDGAKTWENGTIYDPRNGKMYSSIITEVNENQLNVRGYIGFSLIGRTSILTRATTD